MAHAGATISIGESVWIGADCEISSLGRVSIGSQASLQHRTQLHGDVSIGAGCTCAAGLYISSGWHEFRRAPHLPIRLQDRARVSLPPRERSRPVAIGEDCWLGIGVVVMPGVTIGRGSIVGANSVVTGDVPPYSIVAGAPARVVGERLCFDPPRSLDAMLDEHLPYFYEGFSQVGRDELGLEPPRERGGLVAGPRFVLAAAVAAGDVVELAIDAAGPGCLMHGEQHLDVPAGPFVARLSAAMEVTGFMAFAWQPAGAGSLAVTGLQVQTGGES